MKYVISGFLMLIMSTALWAQGDNPGPCGFSFIVEDHTCGDGCVSNNFTAPQTASDYYLFCQLINCTGNPDHCRVTVTLIATLGTIPVATCESEGQEDCGNLVSSQTITLQQGVQYRLTVCLNGCFSYPCSDCGDCIARAQVCHR
jgi:hypothetical protein